MYWILLFLRADMRLSIASATALSSVIFTTVFSSSVASDMKASRGFSAPLIK
ncbi:MAG: hypothetical protein K2K14_03815 [Ruminococcus sp.]|nr:hypothetical protein [Ruminococcus sp.]